MWVRTKGLTKLNPVSGAIEDASDESRVLNMVLPAILIALMFVGFPWAGGLAMLIYLAGLQQIPSETIEASIETQT